MISNPHTTMQNVLEFKNASCRYGFNMVLNRVSFSVPRGSVTALLGPNGAGKSTAMRAAVNLLSPSSGEVTVLDTPSRKIGPAQLRRIGYVADGMDLPQWMTVDQFLAWCRPLYPQWDAALEQKLRAEFDLPGGRKLSDLSRGQRMKAALLSSLAYRPELVLLDEPFSGLDPVVRDEFIGGLLELAGNEGWSLLISSHDIEEVQKLADRVVVLNHGRVKLEESAEELIARHRQVEVLMPSDAPRPAQASGWIGISTSGRLARFIEPHYDEAELAKKIAQFLPGAVSHTVSAMPLRDVFVALVKAGKADAGA
jgi:ABC-2 type transport system ATP-binding protein